MISFMLFGFVIVKLGSIAESEVTERTIVGETAGKMFCLHVIPDTRDIDVGENVAKSTEISSILLVFAHKLDQFTWIGYCTA